MWGVVAPWVTLCELPGVVVLAWCCGVLLQGVVAPCVALCESLGVVVLARCCGVSLQGVVALCVVLHELLGVSSLCSVVVCHCRCGVILIWCVVGCCPHAVC